LDKKGGEPPLTSAQNTKKEKKCADKAQQSSIMTQQEHRIKTSILYAARLGWLENDYSRPCSSAVDFDQ